jgi:hypothetical protein
MTCLFRAPLYIPLSFNTYENLILWQRPYHGCAPFYGFEDGLHCPITFDLRGLM